MAEIRANQPPGVPARDLATELELLKYRELVLAQQQAVADQRKELDEKLKAQQQELELLRAAGPGGDRPYSFLWLEELRAQLTTEEARRESSGTELEAARQLLQSVRQTQDDAGRQRRQAKEALETNRDPQEVARLTRNGELLQLYCDVADDTVQLKLAEIENFERKLQWSELRTAFLREKIERVAPEAKFSAQDLETSLAKVDRAEQLARDEIREIQVRLKEIEPLWYEARQQRDQAGAGDLVAAERLRARQAARESCQTRLTILNQFLADLVVSRVVWNRRYSVLNQQATPADLLAYRQEVQGFLDRNGRVRQLLVARLNETRLDLSAQEQRLQADRDQGERLPWIKAQQQELQQLANDLSSFLVRLDDTARLLGQHAEELDQRAGGRDLGAYLATAGAVLHEVWHYELTAIDDSPITVGKILTGLTLLAFGYFLSGRLSRLLGSRVLPRLGMQEGVSTALQTIAFYVLLAMFCFVSLELINVPLTVFAFLGGAVAIGVGFGSQNVVNNFISGLILLAERPIRVGDLIEIGGLQGTVVRIGARSTRVRNGANLEIVVPNSKFLESHFVNWTLSDTRIRVCVPVGVAYGSPTRDVTRLLLQAVDQNIHALKTPEPFVLFKDFGDSSLLFEVYFWLHMRTMTQAERIKSEVRVAIDDLLREAGISIAFPQRDIHLDTARPIEIKLHGLDTAALPEAKPRRRAA
jgi:small-conductance mechanosensitive channel